MITWTTPGTLAQNSPPKAESDCAITSMCSTRTSPPPVHGTPLWAAELVMFAVVVALAVIAYRVVTKQV